MQSRFAIAWWRELLGGVTWVGILVTQVWPTPILMGAFAFFSGAVVVRALRRK